MGWLDEFENWLNPQRAFNALFVANPPDFVTLREQQKQEKATPPERYTQSIAAEFSPLQDRKRFGNYSGIKPAHAAYLVDVETGKAQMIAGENENHPLAPASTIKMLTLGLTAKWMKENNLTLDSVVKVPKAAYALDWDLPSTPSVDDRLLARNGKMKLRDLVALASIKSNNAAAEALGLLVTGQQTSEAAYADLANYTVREVIGAQHTLVTNPTGLPHLKESSTDMVELKDAHGKPLLNVQQTTAADAVKIFHWAYQQMPDDMLTVVNSENHRMKNYNGQWVNIKPHGDFARALKPGDVKGYEDVTMQVGDVYNKTGMIGDDLTAAKRHLIYSGVAVRSITVDGKEQQLVVFAGGYNHRSPDIARTARDTTIAQQLYAALPEVAAPARARHQLDKELFLASNPQLCTEPLQYDITAAPMTPAQPLKIGRNVSPLMSRD